MMGAISSTLPHKITHTLASAIAPEHGTACLQSTQCPKLLLRFVYSYHILKSLDRFALKIPSVLAMGFSYNQSHAGKDRGHLLTASASSPLGGFTGGQKTVL
jgi:hypothetical protein